MLSYLFATTPGQEFSYYWPMLIGIAVILIASFLLKNLYRKKVKARDVVFKKMFKKTPNRLTYFAIGFVFFTLVRYETIPYFSMRIWLYLISIGFLTYLGFNLYKYFRIYPEKRDNFEAKQVAKPEDTTTKYLPNKKRR